MDLSWPEVVLGAIVVLSIVGYFSFIVWCTTNGRNVKPIKREQTPTIPMWTTTYKIPIPGDKPGRDKTEDE